jgi:halogenation protein CepH
MSAESAGTGGDTRVREVDDVAPSSADEYDVIVVGGGPSGSSAATLVAKAGHRVLLLEKEVFPRFQIGESLLPSTIHGVCRLLGVTKEIAEASFMPKRGGTFLWGANPEPWTFHFAASPLMHGGTATSFQVERMRFDEILLRNAAREGVDVREGVTVGEVLERDGRVAGVAYTGPGGERREATASYVVDASGNRSSLYRSVGDRRYSSFFQNLALFGYFEGGKRLPGDQHGNILSCAFDEGWFWYIPLSDTLTSVGAVVRREYADALQGDPEAAYRRLIGRCPLVADYLSGVPRVAEGVYGRIRVRKDYSYTMEHFWRPGLVLVGDAACFIDPVFSTGVHLATYSALLAARSINSCLAGELDETRAFTEFDERYRREYRLFYEFLTAFYDTNAREDSYFWKAKKVTGLDGTELEAFASLVGGTTAEAGLLLSEAARELGDALAPGEAGSGKDRVAAVFGSSSLTKVRQGMRQLPAELRGEAAGITPVTSNGLIPTADQLRWREPAGVGDGN